MVTISSQYSFDAYKAVQISQAVFLDKGTQSNYDTKTAKSPYESGYQIFIMSGSFGFKLWDNFNIALFSLHTQKIVFILKF